MNKKNAIKLLNLKVLSEESGISYNTLKNFSSGRRKELTKEEIKQIELVISKFIKYFFK